MNMMGIISANMYDILQSMITMISAYDMAGTGNYGMKVSIPTVCIS